LTAAARIAGLLVAAAVGAGCASDVELEPTFRGVQEAILEPTCALASCHRNPDPQQGLDFSNQARTRETAFNVPPLVGSAAERYPGIIVPGDADASFLIAKVTQPGADDGLPMPPTELMLTEEAVETLRQWIDEMEVAP
jgi:hypothetical protein